MKTIFAVLLIVALAGCSFADSVTVTATMAMEPSAMQPSSTASAGSQCMEGQYCLFIFKDENAASTEGTNATCGTATYVSESPILLNTPCFPINTASDNVTKVWAVVNTTNATIDGANVTQYDGALYTDSTCSGTALPFGCSETCTNQTCLDSCMTDTCVQLPVAGWAYYLASDYSRIPEGTVPSSVIPSGGASATQTMMATATATVMPTDVVATATATGMPTDVVATATVVPTTV